MRRLLLRPVPFACLLGINSLGSSLSTFGLTAWIFQVTGSYAAMTLLGIVTPVTVVIFAPLAGLAADRYEKRSILIIADGVACLGVLLAIGLYANGMLNTSLAISLALCLSCANEFRYTASASLIPAITAREELLRVNAVQQVFRGGSLMLGPLLGAVGFSYLGLPMLLAGDALTFALSAIILLCAKLGNAPFGEQSANMRRSVVAEWRQGLCWLSRRPPLVTLLIAFMLANSLLSIFMVALPPYVMAARSNLELGLVSAAIGAGMFLSGLSLTGLKKRIPALHILIASISILGVVFIVIGLAASRNFLWLLTPLVGAAVACLASANQTIWHSQTPQDIQGRIIAVRSVVTYLLAPFSVLVSAPLVVSFIAPVLVPPSNLGLIWGSDLAGALGLLISLLGALLLGLACFVGTSRSISQLQHPSRLGTP
ncbi:MFS transporter [Pseudomonas aeruginosa]|uniref:MFS transporter n=1 Tax=Pseudomonas aeruginosa TaxID=287 RepID=UPI0005A73745|nr:MFS transporter [Pseudomonas aeruginosa]QMX81128.1 MFS transporter [Pseudomonas aeruginosa]RPP77565.1 MFS transporter [Pseudomonas aeruginosa]UEG12044.1 MFS transporter [Pseudomonas aeruginosa]HCD9747645.1 MFS transporter [Pseudomonas aeruginosa]HCE3959547.1 MFS transporter [Pseudomonas aeruginosa]